MEINEKKLQAGNRQRSLLTKNWMDFLQSSLASRSSRLMSRATNPEIWQEICARWKIGMADWWESLGLMPSSVLAITYLPRVEGRMLTSSVSHVPMGTATIIWDQIGATLMLPLTIQNPLHPLHLFLITQVIPIQPSRSSPTQSRHKSEAVLRVSQRPHHNGGPRVPYHRTICSPECVCPQKGFQRVYKIFNLYGSSVEPNIDSVEQSMKDVLALERCIL